MEQQLKTRIKIVEALDECMNEKTIDRVHVSDICHIAGISRTTFYQYFKYVEEVGTWLWDFLMDETLYQAGRRYNVFEAHLRKFRALLGYKHFFMCAFLTTEYSSITQHGGRMMQERYEDILTKKMGRALTNAETLEVEFFVTGAKYMTRTWVKGGMVESPEMMAHVFANAIPDFAKPYMDAAPEYDNGPSYSDAYETEIAEILGRHGVKLVKSGEMDLSIAADVFAQDAAKSKTA